MTHHQKTPLYTDEDHEFLGYVVQDSTGWQAQTIFGYTIARTHDRVSAENLLREVGANFLEGVWQYFDKDDQDWHTCVINGAQERQVTVLRTNAMGYQEPDDYKLVVLLQPSENTLTKLS